MISSLIYLVGGFIETLIGLRFVFLLLGANPASDFVHWIYSWSAPFVAPFAGIFGQNITVTGSGAVTASIFDWAALTAFVIIGLFVALVGGALRRTAHRV